MKNVKNYALYGLLALVINVPTLNASHYDPQRQLMKGLKRSNRDQVKKALEHGANPDVLVEDNNTPLHYAANRNTEGNSAQLVNLLMQYGAQKSINESNNYGQTPLYMAADSNNPYVVDFLLGRGALFGKAVPQRISPEITKLLQLAQVIEVSNEKLASIIHNLSDQERERALYMLQERLKALGEVPTKRDRRLFAVLRDPTLLDVLQQSITEGTNLPPDLSAIIYTYVDPLEEDKS